VIHASTEGLVFQRLLTLDLMPDEIFRAAFAPLGKKVKRPTHWVLVNLIETRLPLE
jgi:hypothetical protein